MNLSTVRVTWRTRSTSETALLFNPLKFAEFHNQSPLLTMFKGSRQQHVHCQGQRVCQQSQSTWRESSLPPWTGLWQTSLCIKGTHHWRSRAVVAQRAPWHSVSKVLDSHNVVCFDAAFRITRLPGAPRHVCGRFYIQQRRQWRRSNFPFRKQAMPFLTVDAFSDISRCHL